MWSTGRFEPWQCSCLQWCWHSVGWSLLHSTLRLSHRLLDATDENASHDAINVRVVVVSWNELEVGFRGSSAIDESCVDHRKYKKTRNYCEYCSQLELSQNNICAETIYARSAHTNLKYKISCVLNSFRERFINVWSKLALFSQVLWLMETTSQDEEIYAVQLAPSIRNFKGQSSGTKGGYQSCLCGSF